MFSFALFAKLLGARNRGRACADMPMPKAPALQAKIHFQIRIVPADGTRAAKRKRRPRYVAVFGQLSVKAICLSVSTYLGYRDQSTMAWPEIKKGWMWLRLQRPDPHLINVAPLQKAFRQIDESGRPASNLVPVTNHSPRTRRVSHWHHERSASLKSPCRKCRPPFLA